jgi:hypothetical protein
MDRDREVVFGSFVFAVLGIVMAMAGRRMRRIA